jgi:hypothetical protein
VGPDENLWSNNCLQLKGSFDGFRLVLIGDLHEQPMLHLRIKSFIVGAKDWSGEVGHKDVEECFLTKITGSCMPQVR